jgi:hypothetical protein
MSPSDEMRIKALEMAADTSKQILGLSTAALGLTLTYFEKTIESGNVPNSLRVSWVAFAIACACGVLTLMAITGSASSKGAEGPYGANVQWFAVPMAMFFAVGLIATIVAVW